MPFEICPVVKSDIETFTKLMYAAYRKSPVSKLLYTVPASASLIEASAKANLEGWGRNPNQRLMQVKDRETGDMISAVDLYFMPQREEGDDDWKKVHEFTCPDGFNRERFSEQSTKSFLKRNEIMGPQPYFFLQTLITHPEHRRRGAASLLLKWSMQQAHDHNLPIFLTASPIGLPLYNKAGFRVVDELIIDLSPIGWTERYVNVCLTFPAPSPSEISKSPSINSKILIAPVTDDSDYLRLAKVEEAAWVGDRLMSLCFPPNPNAKNDIQVRAVELSKELEDRPTVRYIKAVDVHSEEIIGWATWYFVEDPDKPLVFSRDWPPGANVALCKRIFSPMNKVRADHMKRQKYFFLGILVVIPGYQRKGIGSQLLDWGLKQADEKGYPCYLDASPQGLGLYKKFGWEEAGFDEIDEGDWGGERGVIDRVVYLIRPPKERAA